MLANYDYTYRRSARRELGRRGSPIDVIVIHHWGVEGQKWANLTAYLLDPKKSLSVHYIAMEGKVEQQVDEVDTAWHGGNVPINIRSIGIECRPEATDGDYDTVAELVADIWSRHGKLPMIGHNQVPSVREDREFVATACPGKWDLERLKKESEKWYARKYEPAPEPELPDPKPYAHEETYITTISIQGYERPRWQGEYMAVRFLGEKIETDLRVDYGDNSFVHDKNNSAWYLIKSQGKKQARVMSEEVHVVRHGDTLWSIASKYLGAGMRYTDILAWNEIADPSKIRVGQVLRIPRDDTRLYVVRRNDSPWSIATKELGNGKRWTEIAELNDLGTPPVIYTGQTLEIPAS